MIVRGDTDPYTLKRLEEIYYGKPIKDNNRKAFEDTRQLSPGRNLQGDRSESGNIRLTCEQHR